MSGIATNLRNDLCAVAGTRMAEDTRESWLARGARRAGISFRQAKAIYYGEVSDPRASVVEAIRAAKDRHVQSNAERLRDELTEARALIARLEERIALLAETENRAVCGPIGKANRRNARAGQMNEYARA